MTFSTCDLASLKLAVFFGTAFIMGLLSYWISPFSLINFIVDWKWGALALAVLFAVKPMWRYFFKREVVVMPKSSSSVKRVTKKSKKRSKKR